jgi:hypothetical protein
MKNRINWNAFRDAMVYEGLAMRAEFNGLELLVCRDIHAQDASRPFAWNISSMKHGELFSAGLCASFEEAIEAAEKEAIAEKDAFLSKEA